MKSLLPLTVLLMSFAVVEPSQAQVSRRPHYTRHYNVVAFDYCTQERFQSYVNLAASMRDYVTPHEYARLYIPLKIRASKALITLKNYGPLSATTHDALYSIVSFVNSHQASFDALWEVEAFYGVATDLMDMTQSLSRDLQ